MLRVDYSSLDDFLNENALCVENIKSSDPTLQHTSIQRFRKILHKDDFETRQIFIRSGLIPKFIDLLKDDAHPKIQFEAAWALTNILSGSSEQTEYVVELGIVPILVDLISKHADEDVRAQAVWALGNIVGDGVPNRNLVLEAGALPILLHLVEESSETTKMELLRNLAWILSNVFKRQPRPSAEVMKQSMPVLVKLLNASDEEAIKDTCWTFSFIADGPPDQIQLVINSGVLPRISTVLATYSEKPEITRPAVRTLGSIAAGDDLQTQAVLSSGALRTFPALLEATRDNLVKDVCWTISNITAGNSNQIQAVVDANLIPKLVALCYAKKLTVRKEALWALGNITDFTPGYSKREIVFQGAATVSFDPKIIVLVLDALKRIYDLAPSMNAVAYRRSMGVLRSMNLLF